MPSLIRRTALLSLATAVLSLAAAAPAVAGPPWISIELPANPLDPTTRGAFLLVHTYHHEQATRELVVGQAISIVDGRRRTIDLDFERTASPGVLALRQSWPTSGAWVLVISVGPRDGAATAVVSVGADGAVRDVRVPTETRDAHTWPRPVTARDIDEALVRAAVRAA